MSKPNPQNVPHTSQASGAADHMIAIGIAGKRIKDGDSELLDHTGLEVSQRDLGNGLVSYKWPAGHALVRHK